MIKSVEAIVIHPLWIMLYTMGYAFGAYVFFKTDSIFAAAFSLAVWMIISVCLKYVYYNIPL